MEVIVRNTVLFISCILLFTACDRGDIVRPGDDGVRINESRLMTGGPWEIVRYDHDVTGDNCENAQAGVRDFTGWRCSFDRRAVDELTVEQVGQLGSEMGSAEFHWSVERHRVGRDDTELRLHIHGSVLPCVEWVIVRYRRTRDGSAEYYDLRCRFEDDNGCLHTVNMRIQRNIVRQD